MAEQNESEHTIITHINGLSGQPERSAYLIFLSGPMMGKAQALEKGLIVLGRANDLPMTIADSGISRRHCEIDYTGNHTMIRDLGSTNGTFVNGVRITQQELKDGDKIQLSSSTILKYAYQDAAENVFHNEIYKMAVVDALTGAYNKKFFEDRMKEEFSFCQRHQVPLSIVLFDLDHFKKINDTYGHPAGDFVLARIGQVAKAQIRLEDVLARYGGEEFVIILKGSPVPGAVSVAQRLRESVEKEIFEFEGRRIPVTVSVGVVTLAKQEYPDWEQMFRTADTLLYRSKNAGRNRVSHS
jgi:diguanylate cyclase (GGDEF)-like protein